MSRADDVPLILHVIHHLQIGGMENGLVNLINTMPASAFRHAIVCVEDFSDFRQRITRPDVQVLAMHRSQIGAMRLRREIFSLCRALKPAVVHTRNLSGLDALLPARLAGVPKLVHSEHGFDVDNLHGGNRKHNLLRRLHSPLVDRYITVSKHLQQMLVEQLGIRADRITQIYNGVDTDRFLAKPRTDLSRLPPGFACEGMVLVGTVGRLQAVKDQASLLRAFAQMLAQQPALRATARLAVVGDGPLAGDLHALADSLGLQGKVWFSGAASDVPALLGLMDVFVLPSLNEGISNTILEAMATGLPVLASAAGGNTELVLDGVTGRWFAPSDVAALSGHLADYVTQAPLRQAHGAASRLRVLENFSLSSMVKAYEAVYR